MPFLVAHFGSNMKRRALLASLGTVAIAGCINVGGQLPENRRSDDAEGELSAVSSDIVTIDTDCGTEHADHSWSLEGDTVVIDGYRPAPNPCHEATIEEVLVVSDTLVVDLGIDSTREQDEVCIECVGKISYQATVEVENPAALETVEVRGEAPW